jgi:hypothetical protein
LNPGENVELFNVDAGSARYSTQFPVNSLRKSEICGFWAEFDALGSKFGKVPVIFPDLRLFEDSLAFIWHMGRYLSIPIEKNFHRPSLLTGSWIAPSWCKPAVGPTFWAV